MVHRLGASQRELSFSLIDPPAKPTAPEGSGTLVPYLGRCEHRSFPGPWCLLAERAASWHQGLSHILVEGLQKFLISILNYSEIVVDSPFVRCVALEQLKVTRFI